MANQLKKIKLDELSLVDRGANQHATVAIFKRAEIKIPELENFAKSYSTYNPPQNATDFKTILAENCKEMQLWKIRDQLYPLFDALNASIASITTDQTLSDGDRLNKIDQSTNDFLSSVKAVLPQAEAEINEIFKFVNAEIGNKRDEANMADIEKAVAEAVEKATKELNEKLEKAAVELAKAQTEAARSDEEKALVAKMSPDDKAAWDKLSAEDKKKKTDVAKAADEVISVSGEEIKKSEVGPAQFAVFKRLAEAEVKISKAEEATAVARFEKRAADEFSALPGTDLEKAQVLKRLADMPKEVAASFEAIMKVAQEASKGAFEVRGVRKGAGDETAEEKIAKKADEIVKRDGISKSVAIAKAWNENPDLYAEYEAEQTA